MRAGEPALFGRTRPLGVPVRHLVYRTQEPVGVSLHITFAYSASYRLTLARTAAAGMGASVS
ncbi:hypothetical protein HMPREF0742_00501 [Rothia aeria F0184]|uniref:Uncharacterized protein n=1 Tax=Rothia aeria F0184 TaxID=888019 RepID=U7V8H7_9MICC|nr:hypothetical protein HMPREF0742_00501 [Rothia aeria F0184]